MKKGILLVLLWLITASCSQEERPSYIVVENTLPEGGIEIEYDPEAGFSNIEHVTSELNADNAQKFSHSLGWYGTESTFPLEKLKGKTARQVVNIVNCLKESESEEKQFLCFD